MIKTYKALTFLFCLFLLARCASTKVTDVSYLKSSKTSLDVLPKLDVYHPNKTEKNPIVIFIHGGYWDEGKKDTYSFLGRNFARKNVVTVVPSYTLSPNGNYDTMTEEIAAAIKWTYNNIEKYNGDPERIYLMGHSAGGHLIALVGTNPMYLESNAVIKGIILNDAAGLDMYSYLKKNPPSDFHHYETTWTKNPSTWKEASPIYFLNKKSPPFLMYVGTKTYPSIISSNEDFVKELNKYQPNVKINYLTKKHVPMMSQYVNPWNKHYKVLLQFMNENK